MVFTVDGLTKDGHVDNTLCLMVLIIVAKMDVFELVGSNRDHLFLLVVQDVARVAIRVEIGDEGRGVVTSCELLVTDDALAETEVVSNTLHNI